MLIASSSVAYFSQYPSATLVPFVPSEVLACQKDVAIDKVLAASQVDWIKAFTQFQSTLALLKKPPSDYDLPPVDVMGRLDAIKQKAAAGGFQGEFDFELELYNLFSAAADSHFGYSPVLLDTFLVNRPPLVSVSVDGLQSPKVYFLYDIQQNATSPRDGFSPSAIAKINGEGVDSYLLKLPSTPSFQTLDARYNFLFYNSANVPGAGNGSFALVKALNYDDSFLVTFENGTFTNFTNFLTSQVEFGYRSGNEMFSDLSGLQTSATASSASTRTARSTAIKKVRQQSVGVSSPAAFSQTATSNAAEPTLQGFPYPVVKHPLNHASGYFLNDTGFTDVAIFNIVAFGSDESFRPGLSFQDTVSKFLVACSEAKKTRLIVDVRGNPGGLSLLGFDTFKQLFPKAPVNTTTRFRAHDAASTISSQTARLTYDGDQNVTNYVYTTFFNFKQTSKTNGDPWPSVSDFYGPQRISGDTFSNRFAYNVSDAATTVESTGITVTGFGNRTNLPQLFKSENILLFTDALCGSTCSIFSNLMMDFGKVRTITAGGRPNKDPMAAIGGTQGMGIYQWAELQGYADDAVKISYNLDNQEGYNKVFRALSTIRDDPPLPPSGWKKGSGGNVNFLDNIRNGDDTQTPRQFTKSYADCRIFYTPTDILNVTSSWNRVASYWSNNGTGLCVATKPSTTSTTGPSSLPSASKKKESAARSTATVGLAALVALFAAMALL
ncbi:MAG: hypothetical protein M1814_004377 [Vezdaea aestivalis]|nr:MAG: hypothetical protein M1814_004377 [Vezdaea aestivalis]